MSNISYTRLQNQEGVDALSTEGFIEANPDNPTVDDDGIFEKAYVREDAIQYEDEKYTGRSQSPCENSFAADAPLLADEQDVGSDASSVTLETASGPNQAEAVGPSPTRIACTHFLVSVNSGGVYKMLRFAENLHVLNMAGKSATLHCYGCFDLYRSNATSDERCLW
jgi:hypothetical protein